jgi:hypothetical protein
VIAAVPTIDRVLNEAECLQGRHLVCHHAAA